LACALIAFALLFSTFAPAFAGTTGTVSGTVTESGTHTGLAGVEVDLISPSGKFQAKTDSKGFFSVIGVQPDTYTVIFKIAGYETGSVPGVSVSPDQVVTVSPQLSKTLKSIGRTTSRSVSSAYQPGQTQDTYTLNSNTITTVNGREFNTNESNLITSLPGGSLDANGYPVLRGGRENEEGLTFDGISIVDPYTTQFTNSLSGNASNGNAGTGTINYTAKRGTYPAFGALEAEAQTNVYAHQLTGEYGFATPDGRFSDYFSFIGQRDGAQYGPKGIPAVDNGTSLGYTSSFGENNLVNNAIWKLGKDRGTELQFLYQNQIDNFQFDYLGNPTSNRLGGYSDPLATGVGFFYGNGLSLVGLSQAGFAAISPHLPLDGYNLTGPLAHSGQYQPNELFKIQLSRSFDSSTFAKLAFYRVQSVVPFQYDDSFIGGEDAYQGGARTGLTLDVTKQLGSANLLQFGARFEYEHPIDHVYIPDDFYRAVGGGLIFGQNFPGFMILDYLNPNSADCANVSAAYFGAPTPASCGYLAANGITGSAPDYVRSAEIDRSTLGYYITDQYTPTTKLKIEAGLRIDSSATHYPNFINGFGDIQYFSVGNEYKHPSVLQPRISANYQLSRNDSIRASFARSQQNAPLADISHTVDANSLNLYANVPSYDATTGLPATWCGPKKNQTCTSYADQLYSIYQYYINGPALQPVKPETFSNYEFSYSHAFKDNVALKITPFYTRGYDIVDLTSTVAGRNPNTGGIILNPSVASNAGVERTTGVEFQLTKDNPYGLSGLISATYINKFSNVPPLSSSEDFFPTIPAASLLLGDTYRVGYLSPFQFTVAGQYKTHSGWRINPQITYNHGYPLNPGLVTATFVNGVPYNVPNTNVSGAASGVVFQQYVDPANPGTLFKPNVAANLGTPATSSAGGILSNARFNTNLTIEYSPPNSRRFSICSTRSTAGRASTARCSRLRMACLDRKRADFRTTSTRTTRQGRSRITLRPSHHSMVNRPITCTRTSSRRPFCSTTSSVSKKW
jgi:hypothetical protein